MALDFSPVGRSGLVRYGGQVQDEWLPELRGAKGRKVIREMMDQDAVIGATLLAFELLIQQMDWRVDPGGKDAADVESAEFVDSALHDMENPWTATLSEILTYLPFGFAWLEQTYKHRSGPGDNPAKRSKHTDGKIGWRSWSLRAQESLYEWQFDDEGGIKAMVQQDPGSGKVIPIPMEKSLLFRTTARKGNPEGRSLLRNAHRAWHFAKHIENIEGIGIERDLAGLPVAYVPASIMSDGASSEEQAIYTEIKKQITGIRRNEQEGAVWPSDRDESGNLLYELKLLSTGGSRQFDTGQIITRYDTRKVMSMLADFIMLGHEKVGSFALADSKTNLFGYALGAFADTICDVVNDIAIPRLLALNGMNLERTPKLMHGDVESANLAEVGEYIAKLSGAGMPLFPNPGLEAHLLAIASLPALEEDGQAQPKARAKPQKQPAAESMEGEPVEDA